MYIPEIGDEWTLASDWTFDLFFERRNIDLITALGVVDHYMHVIDKHRENGGRGYLSDAEWLLYYGYNFGIVGPRKVTLVAGTVIKVDRIYIRKGASDFSSLSFFVVDSPDSRIGKDPKAKGFKKGRKRFWAKLTDVRSIDVAAISEAA